MRKYRKSYLLTAIGIILSLCFLTGCGTSKLYLVGTDYNDNSGRNNLVEVRKHAVALRKAYKKEAKNLRKENSWLFDVPLIGAAAAAAATIYFGAHSDATAGIGIGAATLSGYRTYYGSIERAKIYESGINALQCVIQSSFELEDPNKKIVTLNEKIEDLKLEREKAKGLITDYKTKIKNIELKFRTPEMAQIHLKHRLERLNSAESLHLF